MEASLTGEQGKLKGKVFNLRPGRVYLIGRISVADIRVPDNMVSRNHCKIEFRGDKWFVVDLNSSNGTFVNDDRVDSAELKPGDLLRMGQTSFRFALVGAEVAEAVPEPEPVAPPVERGESETVEDEEGEELFSLLERAEKIEEESESSKKEKGGGLFELLKEEEKEEEGEKKAEEEEGARGGILSFLKKKKKEEGSEG